MSMEKYASLHSGLIARKGEALPTPPVNLAALEEVERLIDLAPAARSGPVNCDTPSGAPRPKRPQRISEGGKASGIKALTFRIDPTLYHRVQVAAAKLGWTSQDLMRAAVEAHLAQLGREVFPNCGCIGGKDGCN